MDSEHKGEMTASRRRRPCPVSPATSPLDDDDLLREILVRLPPKPSSLPRASAVCKRWRRLVSDAGFFRRFRLRHRRNLPLLGFFKGSIDLTFVPTLEAPNRVPPKCFSLPPGVGDRLMCLGCRHGLVLIHLRERHQVLVWDPVTGDQHRFAIPTGVATYAKHDLMNGAVLRTAGDVQHFQVVLAAASGRQALACVYSSQTGLWGDLISIPLPYKANGCIYPPFIDWNGVLVGDSLFWVVETESNVDRILEFDLVKQSLAVMPVPVDMCGKNTSFRIMRAEGGGLGVLLVSHSDCTAQLWKRKNHRDGVVSWVLERTIELDKLLSLKPEEKDPLRILGYAEENNVLFLWTMVGLFMIHLDSLKFKKIFETMTVSQYHPFESVYTAEICAGSGHDRAELLRK